MKQFFKSKIEDGQIVNFIFIVFSIASIAWSLYFARATITLPYQIGFREGQPQVLTQMLLDGENPYTFDNQPLAYNVYSISYSAAVLPFASLFGNTIHIHRLVTFVFIFLSTLLGFGVVYKSNKNFAYALICASFIMIGFMGRGGLGSAPSAMGTFLFYSALFIPFLKSFDKISLWISLFFALWAFYTKAYFVLSFGIVFAYVFLFISKRKAFSYFISFFTLLMISAVVIRLIFPLYFINSIGGNISNTFRTFENLYEQVVDLLRYFFPLIIATFLMLKFTSRAENPLPIKDWKIKDIFNASWSAPVFTGQMNYFLFAFLTAFFVYITFLATHVGNYLTYAYEMVLPPFFFWLFTKFEFKRWIGTITALLIIFNLTYWQNITLNPNMLEQRNSTEWQKLYAFIKPSLKILSTPIVTSRLIELGITPVDSGQTDYYYFMKPYPDYAWFGPPYAEFYAHGEAYAQSINEAIKNQEYDLIITAKDVDVFYDSRLITQYYSLEKQLILYMNQTEQKWVAQIWKPNK
ncbi:MAG: hypothetical protein JNM46_07635 [Anaerolineales bacterium]|nr:hypothetical protein [Anaerolineales bacterium]